MSGNSKLRKWIIGIGSFFVAIGIGFLFVEQVNTVFGIVSLIIGICLYIVSNFFRANNQRVG